MYSYVCMGPLNNDDDELQLFWLNLTIYLCIYYIYLENIDIDN